MSKKIRSLKQDGFTIIELMISTTVFSLVLMITLGGVLQITKMYYRGVTQTNTREAARTVADELAEAVRFSSDTIVIPPPIAGLSNPIVPPGPGDTGYFCVGSKRYTYAIDRQVKTNPSGDMNKKHKRHALWVDTLPSSQPCLVVGPADLSIAQPSSAAYFGRDLLSENMRLYKLELKPIDVDKKTYTIAVGVAYGDNDLLKGRPTASPTELTCEGQFIGVEFCATTSFLVTVQKRL